ncbi:set and ww domain containing protein [Niveomyces insectorum RCEF 264]|uniref:Histone-lysine N-methyltransferase, H3 lysine-36 specific n=1 Tax=Niveomyces insectorum RCEF 264 TaxID=1081102 RepID=A0A167M9U9_9HYPO|nr:set and ww domain containing protein [Niveomyces insectorum RCEF 264]
MDDDDVRIPGAVRVAKMLTVPGVRSNGTRIAVKKEPFAGNGNGNGGGGGGGGDGDTSASPTPNGSKNGEFLSPSLSPDDVKASSSDSASTPDTGPVAPRLSRKSSSLQRKGTPASATPPAAPTRVLFDHLPDATQEATSQFQVIGDCLYGSKNMGSSDHDAFECDCAEEWRDGQNRSCGEDSDCINRATKMECVAGDCNCGDACQNQRFQRKQYASVSVIKTEKKGFGLRADTDLHANDFIFEYIGEVINEPAFRRRMLQYDQEGIKHFYFMSLNKSEFVDATRKGNLGRFCNHSCNPNCYVDKWVVGKKLRMGIFAGRYVRAGEELVFDYNVDRYGANPQPCYCGEPNCTGFIGGKTQTGRATKLSQATIEALGIEDPDTWDTAVSKKPRRKRANEDDEEYVSSLQQTGLAEDGVTKVMAALMQCKEKWIAVKLLARIQAARHDERVLHRVVRMHGYQILRSILTLFHDDDNVVLQVLDILYHFPRLTKNKISDANVETVIETLAASPHEEVAAQSRRLLDEWSKLETAYRIPRKKVDPNAPTTTAAAPTNSFEDRRGRGAAEYGNDDTTNNSASRSQQRAPLSPLSGKAIPKGPRSNIPQRNNNNNFLNNTMRNQRRQQKGSQNGPLPSGWYTATDPNGQVYYYTKSGATTWKRPTQPLDAGPAQPKAPSKAQQEKDAVQEIINNLTKETPRPSASQTPQPPSTLVPETKKEKWRALPIEKQMKIYENTLFPHIKSVTDKFRHHLPKEEIKKFGKEISKKLVASDYKNNRVEDPSTITARQEKKIRAYVRDFFERAVQKYQDHEKRRTEREARHAAANGGGSGSQQTLPPLGATTAPPSQADKDDTPMTSAATAVPATQTTSTHEGQVGVPDDNGDDELAGFDDAASTGDADGGRGLEDDDNMEDAGASPESPAARKRKRAGSSSAPTPSLTPSETPLAKRLKDNEAGPLATPPTPPPPPPPPPLLPLSADDDEMLPPPPPPANGDDVDEDDDDRDGDEATAERQQHEEEEAALCRENEEALRDFEAQTQAPQRSTSVQDGGCNSTASTTAGFPPTTNFVAIAATNGTNGAGSGSESQEQDQQQKPNRL